MSKSFNGYFFVSFALLSLVFTACTKDDESSSPSVSSGYLVFSDDLTIEAGKAIAYRDESAGAVRWTWDFEGGSPARSNDWAPRVTYPEAGSFTTILFTYFSDGSRRRYSLRPKVLPRISPDFSVASRQNEAGTPITFTNLTTGVGEIPTILAENDTLVFYEWTFPGGNPTTSTASNPTVTYAGAGSFDVTLKVTRPVTDTKETTSKQGFIEIE
jgi:hypothetical protein